MTKIEKNLNNTIKYYEDKIEELSKNLDPNNDRDKLYHLQHIEPMKNILVMLRNIRGDYDV